MITKRQISAQDRTQYGFATVRGEWWVKILRESDSSALVTSMSDEYGTPEYYKVIEVEPNTDLADYAKRILALGPGTLNDSITGSEAISAFCRRWESIEVD